MIRHNDIYRANMPSEGLKFFCSWLNLITFAT